MVVKVQGEVCFVEFIGEVIKKNKLYLELKKLENVCFIVQIIQEVGGKNRLFFDFEGFGLNVFDEENK